MEEAVLLDKKDWVATITLNRPDRYNAINQELLNGLISKLENVISDDSMRVIILTGNGKGFCAGADLDGFGENPTPEDVRDGLINYYGKVVELITSADKPIIAAINGPCAGAGLGFALACDYRMMAEAASMRYAFVNIGLVPDAGSGWLLARAVGYHKALEIAINGDKIPAAECKRLGLVSEVISGEDLSAFANVLAQKLVEKPPLAFAGTKRIMNFSMDHGLIDTIAFEAEQQMVPITSEDHKEGVMAFFEKRKPVFTGK